MSNTPLILSAITVIALTGITLTSLKYNSTNSINPDDEMFYDDVYDDYDLSGTLSQPHPKFRYNSVNQNGSVVNEKRVVKRSSSDDDHPQIEYSIIDKNSSMIDESRRQKVKEVK